MMKPRVVILAMSLILKSYGVAAADATEALPSNPIQQGVIEQEVSASSDQKPELLVITVTAERLEENLQTTPVAVTAFSAEELSTRGLDSVSQLTNHVPGLRVNDSQNSQIYIRGIGERTGFARVDPAVGVYLNGIYLPRPDGHLLELLDIEQVQVLRGPQGTLFGKNTTGGALMLKLSKPEFEPKGYVQMSGGEFNARQGKLMLNQTLGESSAVRLAVSMRGQDEPFKLLDAGVHQPEEKRQLVILQTRTKASNYSLDTLLYADRRDDPVPAVKCTIVSDSALFLNGLRLAWAGDTDPGNLHSYRDNCEQNGRQTNADRLFAVGANPGLDRHTDTYVGGLSLEMPWGAERTVKLKLGARDERKSPSLSADSDGGPRNYTENFFADVSKRRSYSLELNLDGEAIQGRLDYTAGLYASDESNYEPYLLFTNLVGQDTVSLGQLALGQQPTPPLLGLGTVPLVGPLTPPIQLSQFDLNNRSAAAFLHGNYKWPNGLQLGAGVRLTRERRRSNLTVIQSDAEAIAARIAAHPLFGPAVEGYHPYLGLGGWSDDPVGQAAALFPDENGDGIADFPLNTNNPFRDNAKVSFEQLSPKLSLGWQAPFELATAWKLDDFFSYLSWAEGFKSGFFEPRLADGFLFVEPEEVTNLELGLKLEALDRRLRLNLALYEMDYRNMQLVQAGMDSQGSLTVSFDNAALAEIRGAELELSWLASANLLVNMSLSKNRYRFLEFTDLAQIPAALGQTVFQDRSDERFPSVPDLTASAGVQYSMHSVWGTFTPRLDVSYTGPVYYGLDRGAWEAYQRDKRLAGADASTRMDFRLSWERGAFSAATYVHNLSDETITNGSVAIGDTVGTFIEIYDAPRTFGLEFGVSW